MRFQFRHVSPVSSVFSFLAALAVFLGSLSTSKAAAPYRTDGSYEDTVRVAILYNHTAVGQGSCPTGTRNVGEVAKDFVLESIRGIPSSNIKVAPTTETTWSDVQSLFPGKLPHVIVHVQAGWHSLNGSYLKTVAQNAVDNAIGWVSLGDDAAHLAEDLFGFQNPQNVPAPMGDATKYDDPGDRLWIELSRSLDTLEAPGIIRNAVDSILSEPILEFKDYAANGRCQADADKYDLVPTHLDNLTFLGHQRAYDASSSTTIGGPTELPTIASFQTNSRRGVSLSFQPQYLKNQAAAEQIVYDAIIYASFAHLIFQHVQPIVPDPPAGSFSFRHTVTLSTSTPGAVIWYTTDGSDPRTSSTVKQYSIPITFSSKTTIKAYGTKLGFVDSEVMTANYTLDNPASSLQILDAFGNPIPNNTLSERDSDLMIRLTTAYQIGSASATGLSQSAGDIEILSLGSGMEQGGHLVFNQKIDFIAGAKSVGSDGKIQSDFFDRIVITWKNPLNASDVAVDTVFVHPFPRKAEAWFSGTSGGPFVQKFDGDENSIFVVVRDQIFHPDSSYSMIITTADNSGGSVDELIVQIGRIDDSTYGAEIDLNLVHPGNNSDSRLQVIPGDQIRGVYVDPIGKDEAVANAGFGVAVEVTASLVFTDASGKSLTPGTIWSPSEGKLYLSYVDDYAGASVGNKLAVLTITNTNAMGRTTRDGEQVTLTMVDNDGARATWKGSIALGDDDSPTEGNDKAEVYFKGRVHGAVRSHNNLGQPLSDSAKADLMTAYPDEAADLHIEDADVPEEKIERSTTGLVVTVTDQNFSTSTKDTITAELRCSETGDFVKEVLLIEQEDGTYVSQRVEKGESTPSPNDSVLSCRSTGDEIIVTYMDPIYGTITTKRVRFTPVVQPRLFFAAYSDSSSVETVFEQQGDTVLILIHTLSASRDFRDTILVKLATLVAGSPDEETFAAIETAPMSELFVAKVPFRFLVSGHQKNNGSIEAPLVNTLRINRTLLQASASLQGETFRDTVQLVSNFNLVTSAWIKDGDGDGKADSVFFRFDRPLGSLPGSIEEITWNQSSREAKSADGSTLGFVRVGGQEDRTLMVADFGDNSWPYGSTSIPNGERPHATFPVDGIFGGQQPGLQDSVGPVVIKATRLSGADGFAVIDGKRIPKPDTLMVQVSERLVTDSSNASRPWNQMLRYRAKADDGTNCADVYEESALISTYRDQEPDFRDGNLIRMILATSVNLGDCIYLNSGGPYTDALTNRPGKGGVEIDGPETPRRLVGMIGYPPVVGLDASSDPTRFLAVQTDDGSTYFDKLKSTSGSVPQVLWVPPIGFNATANRSIQFESSHSNPSSQCPPLDGTMEPLPSCLSALLVTTTAPYLADVFIYDNLGNFLTSFQQSFGWCGEMENPDRYASNGRHSFLVWNMRDEEGQAAGQGVYVWKTTFNFLDQNKTQEVRIQRTGILRNPDQCPID